MGKNINQITTGAVAVLPTDKLYLGRSPYGVTDDRFLLGSNMNLTYVAAEAGTSSSFYPLIKNLGADATNTDANGTPVQVGTYNYLANFFATSGQYLIYNSYYKTTTVTGSDSYSIQTQFRIDASTTLLVNAIIPITTSTNDQITRIVLKVVFRTGNFLDFDYNVYSIIPGIGAPIYTNDLQGEYAFTPTSTFGVSNIIQGTANTTVTYRNSSIIGV